MGTAASTAEAVRELVNNFITTADSAETPLRDMCQKVTATADDNFRWIMKYLENASSTTFSESEAFPAPGSTSTAQAYLPYSAGYCVTRYSITGHAIDNAMNGNFNPLIIEAESAKMKHLAYKESLLATGFEAAIDSSGNYAGLVRSTVKTASYEASVGTEAISDLDTMFDTLAAAPISCPTSQLVLLSGVAAARKYINKGLGVAYNEFNHTPGAVPQLNKMAQLPQYGDSVWKIINTLTSSTLLAVMPSLMYCVEKRPITVEPLVRVDDTWVGDITSSEIPVYLNPRWAGKLTDI
jgi:hypothetical protein